MSDMFSVSEAPVQKAGYEYLWVEKYRAKSLKGVILPAQLTRMFNKFIEEKEIPNLFFYSSSPGTGKTTTAKALLNDCEYDYKVINASKDSGVDTLRSEIIRFAKTFSAFGLKKAIILDEFDGSSTQFQQALRATMEDVHDNCRFIIICNYESRIIKPLKSRIQPVSFDFSQGKVKDSLAPRIVKRLETVLKKEGVDFKEEALPKFVDLHYPDVRKMLNVLQMFSKQNEMITEDVFSVQRNNQELWDLILDCKYNPALKYVLSNGYDFDDLYGMIHDELHTLVPPSARAEVIKITAECCFRSAMVVHKQVIFSDFLIRVMQEIREAKA